MNSNFGSAVNCSAQLQARQMLSVQWQRLLHLRHAAKCCVNPLLAQRCTVSPFCGKLKRLWPHLLKCKEDQCQIPLCHTSRMLLYHYGHCQNGSCPLCHPIRSSMKRTATCEDERELLDEFQVCAPPAKRVRRSSSKFNLSTGECSTSFGCCEAEGKTCASPSSSASLTAAHLSDLTGCGECKSVSSETSMPLPGSVSGNSHVNVNMNTSDLFFLARKLSDCSLTSSAIDSMISFSMPDCLVDSACD